MIRLKIPLRSRGYELTREDVIKLYYQRKLSSRDIAAKISRSKYYVDSRIRKLGFKLRENTRSKSAAYGIPFDESFFNQWGPNMAYVIGLLYADGNLYDKRFKLVLKDKDHIIKVANTVQIPQEYIFEDYKKELRKYYYGFQISRSHVADRLREIGLVENKSKVIEFPRVPIEFIKDFIRGYFDGDGSVYIGDRRLYVDFTCGSLSFMKVLEAKLRKIFNHLVDYEVDRRGSTNYRIRCGVTSAVRRFYKYIYYDGCVCLQRKRDVFDKYFAKGQY